MSRPTALDHIVIAGPDLAGLVAWFRERTGIDAPAGGRHPTGTANHLVALTVDGARGPHYIELIGPDPEAGAVPTTFGIDRLSEPTVVGFAIHPDDIEAVSQRARAAGVETGPVEALSRPTPDGGLLEWTLTRGGDNAGPVPFLIDWGASPQPGLGALPTIELVTFERIEVDASAAAHVSDNYRAFGLDADATPAVTLGNRSGFRLVVRDAAGRDVELS